MSWQCVLIIRIEPQMASKIKSLFRSSKSRSAAAVKHLPAQPIDGPAPTASNLPRPQDAIGPGTHYGIEVLYDPSEDGKQAIIDIVFVHGLTGNSYNTWLHKETGIHWPNALLKQDIPDARILTFGYDADVVNVWNPASSSRLSNHAENLVGDLVGKREETDTESRKLLFIAHSLGGLVIELALTCSRNAVENHLRQIEQHTTGIVFLGVPHSGSDLASSTEFLTQILRLLKQANTDIVGVLKPGSEMLRVTEKNFHNNLRLRKDENSEISITCFYEELATTGIGEVLDSLVVTVIHQFTKCLDRTLAFRRNKRL